MFQITIIHRSSSSQGFNYSIKTVKKHDSNGPLSKIIKKHPQIIYVIGYVTGDNETLQHELRHYRYYSDKEYKKRCDDIFWKKEKLWVEMRNKGYRSHVLLDEIQAFYPIE